MNRVHLSDNLREITPEIFTTATAIVGVRGSGKTSTAVVLNEQAIGIGVPVAIVDPTGVWHGLKSSRDGKSPGLPVYVFGGQHGDVPLEPDAGKIIARFIVDERVPIVLDVSDLSKTKQRRFVADFCEALYDLKARKRDPLLLTIDEAPRFCPQTLTRGDVELSRCVGAVEDVFALGRSRGLGGVIIGQRAATINNNILTQADNLCAMRSVGTADRKAIDAWVVEAQGDQQQRDELIRHLAALPQGEGYFWSPAIFGVFRRVKFAQRATFDSSRTPKIGEKIITPRAFASVDLDKLRGEIEAAVERAKADDPKALRAELAAVKKELATAGGADPAEVRELRARIAELEARPPERVEVPVLTDLDRATLGETRATIRHVDEVRADLVAMLDAIERRWPVSAPVPARPEPVARPQRPAPTIAPPARPTPPRAQNADEIGGGPIKMLQAVAASRDGALTALQLGTITGYVAGGSTYRQYLAKLRAAGYADVVAGRVVITDAGRSAAGDVTAVATSAETVDLWRAKLGPERAFLEVAIAAYPVATTRDAIAAETGKVNGGSTFRQYLAKIKALGLVEVNGDAVRATDALFPTGPIR